MSLAGDFAIGKPIAVSGNTQTVVLPRSGQVLGALIVSGTSVTIQLWDAATTAAATGNGVLGGATATLTNGTYLPLNFDLSNGLVVTLGGTTPIVCFNVI